MLCFLYSSLFCRDFWVGEYFFFLKPLDLTQAQNIYYALLYFSITNESISVALPFAHFLTSANLTYISFDKKLNMYTSI